MTTFMGYFSFDFEIVLNFFITGIRLYPITKRSKAFCLKLRILITTEPIEIFFGKLL